MTVLIPDIFDGEQGFAEYDSTYENQPIPAALLTNRHVDLRIFDLAGLQRPREMTDFEIPPLTMTGMDGDTMTFLEEVLLIPGETWSVASGTGGAISSTMATDGFAGVGEWTAYNSWRALRFDCNGATLATTLLSNWPLGSTGASTDISQQNVLSLVIDDSALTNTNKVHAVTMKLNSDPLGAFGNGHDSATITLTQSGKQWTANVSGITGSCDLTAVTGLQVTISDDGTHHPTNGQSFYLFAIRAYQTGYDPSVGLDINTRRGAVGVPVTFTVTAPSSTVPMIRGTTANDPGDPRPQDGTGRLCMRLGELKIATGGPVNTIGVVFREDRATENYVDVLFNFSATAATWQVKIVNAGSASTSSATSIGSGNLTTLTSLSYFIFEASIQTNKVTVTLYESDANETLGPIFYTSTQQFTTVPALRGRMGWYANFVDRDPQIQSFNGFALAFSTLITTPMQSLTPVDGVQLNAAYSLDDNLFTTFSGNPAPPAIDTQRTLSGSSFLTNGPIVSNTFLINNFNQSYLEFDIWVPAQVSPANQPAVVLRSPVSAGEIDFPPLGLQGNQWNHIYIDFAETQAAGGIIYQVYLERTEGTGTSYQWNVDNFVIGARNVAWSARSNPLSNWVEFRDTVNDATGGVHFAHDDRGSALQIQAEALTQGAWIGPFSYQPRYAQLGRPIYSA